MAAVLEVNGVMSRSWSALRSDGIDNCEERGDEAIQRNVRAQVSLDCSAHARNDERGLTQMQRALRAGRSNTSAFFREIDLFRKHFAPKGLGADFVDPCIRRSSKEQSRAHYIREDISIRRRDG